MSEINYQALREAAEAAKGKTTWQNLQAFHAVVTPEVVLAMLDVLDAPQEVEPVAWKVTFTQVDQESNTFTAIYFDKAEVEHWVRLHKACDFSAEVTPLYTAPPVSVLPEDVRRTLAAVAKLNNEMYRWTSCMSYNGSYVGEPSGLLKGHIREIEHIMDAHRAWVKENGDVP